MAEPAKSVRIQHRAGERVLFIATGLVIGLTSGLLGLGMLWSAVQDGRRLLVAVALCLFFVALSFYGFTLAARGFHGTSTTRPWMVHWSDRFERRANEIVLGIGCVLGVSAWLLTNGQAPRSEGPILLGFWYAAVGSLLVPICVATHELGHAIAGWSAGLRLSSLQVGPVTVHRKDSGRRRISWGTSSLGGRLGFVQALSNDELASPLRYAIFVLGGPLGSGLSAAGFYATATSLADSPYGAKGVAAVLWAGYFVNLFLLLGSVVPYRLRSGLENDGALFLSTFSKNTPAALYRRWLSLQRGGRRPRDWGVPASKLVHAADVDRRARPTLLLLALAVALDNADYDGADSLLEIALREPANRVLTQEIELQAVMVDALIHGERNRARERFTAMGPHLTSGHYSRLAESAVLLAEGRATDARDAFTEWKAVAQVSGAHWAGGNEWALDLLEARLLGAHEDTKTPPSEQPP